MKLIRIDDFLFSLDQVRFIEYPTKNIAYRKAAVHLGGSLSVMEMDVEKARWLEEIWLNHCEGNIDEYSPQR